MLKSSYCLSSYTIAIWTRSWNRNGCFGSTIFIDERSYRLFYKGNIVKLIFNSSLLNKKQFEKIQQRYARLKDIECQELLNGDISTDSANNSAAYSVIFPLFVKVLWANVVVNLYVFVIAINFTFKINDEDRLADAAAFSAM